MKRVPFTKFGKTRLVPLVVVQDGNVVNSDEWDEVLWVEKAGECDFALLSAKMRAKKVLVVYRSSWLKSPIVEEDLTAPDGEDSNEG